MPAITQQTATDIALAWREIEAGEKLLAEIEATLDRHSRSDADIRDVFGRRQHELQLGVPSGDSGHRLYGVSFNLAVPVIEAHIANCRAKLSALTLKAVAEASADPAADHMIQEPGQ